MAINFLTTDHVIGIQQSILANSGAPDLARLEGAIGRVHNLHVYERCEDVHDLAAMYLVAIAKAHAFNDANKRTAFVTTSTFLGMNGYLLYESPVMLKVMVLTAESEGDYKAVSFVLKVLTNYRDELLEGYDDDYL